MKRRICKVIQHNAQVQSRQKGITDTVCRQVTARVSQDKLRMTALCWDEGTEDQIEDGGGEGATIQNCHDERFN